MNSIPVTRSSCVCAYLVYVLTMQGLLSLSSNSGDPQSSQRSVQQFSLWVRLHAVKLSSFLVYITVLRGGSITFISLVDIRWLSMYV